jgi:uncharacterized protein YoxC
MVIHKTILEPALIQFTLQDLFMFLSFLLVLAIGILLISVLWNMKKVTGIIRSVLEKNLNEIERTVQSMPEIAENMEQITGNISETTETFNASFPEILEDTASITHSAKNAVETVNAVVENLGCGIVDTVSSYKKNEGTFLNYLHIFEDVLQIIVSIFLPRKKKTSK